MKAFFVTSWTGNGGYSMIAEVEGKNLRECVYNGISAFDKEKISGEGYNREEIIKNAAEQYLNIEPQWRSDKSFIPDLSRYFDPEYMKVSLIYVDEAWGKLTKKDVSELVKKFFRGTPKEVEAEVNRIEKDIRKKEYEKLKQEFEV